MPVVIEKPSLLAQLLPWFKGFDVPLMVIVLLLAAAGLLTMYSSGYDHGTRFEDHGRNMLIAFALMFLVAQVPPQRLMTVAVPLYAAGLVLLVAVAFFGVIIGGGDARSSIGARPRQTLILRRSRSRPGAKIRLAS